MSDMAVNTDFASLGLGPAKEEKSSETDLGQEDFMTLMITQFRNQNPFEPTDNGEFLGQLAQFGTVDGIERLNSAFLGLSDSIYSDQALKAATLVGKDVLAVTDKAYLPESGSLSGAIELSSSAQDVEIDITDASGQLVQRLKLGARSSGTVEFEWNGLTDAQQRADAGNYTISARAVRGREVESVETMIRAGIDSVSLGKPGQSMSLNLTGGDSLSMGQVRRIL